jgi:hypothetical protein
VRYHATSVFNPERIRIDAPVRKFEQSLQLCTQMMPDELAIVASGQLRPCRPSGQHVRSYPNSGCARMRPANPALVARSSSRCRCMEPPKPDRIISAAKDVIEGHRPRKKGSPTTGRDYQSVSTATMALERGYRELVSMLSKLPSGVPIAVVMVDIYLRFAHRLRADGFNVIKRRIPFPAHNRQNKEKFREEFASIVAEYDI